MSLLKREMNGSGLVAERIIPCPHQRPKGNANGPRNGRADPKNIDFPWAETKLNFVHEGKSGRVILLLPIGLLTSRQTPPPSCTSSRHPSGLTTRQQGYFKMATALGGFKAIAPVPSASDFIDIALSSTQRKVRTAGDRLLGGR
jgi:hypothetical protein